MKQLLFFLLAGLTLAVPLHAHQHLGIGYLDTNSNNAPNQDEPLRLVNAPSPGTVFHLLPRTSGNYAGYYSLDEFPRVQDPNDYFTFTALSDGQAELANPAHAATGSYIWAEITSVTGPAGGSIGFWDEDWSYFNSTPTASFATNQPTGGFRFALSEPLGTVTGPDGNGLYDVDPGEDPYGHIHNRGWTATIPGAYSVTFTFLDLSTNGLAGDPFHAASQGYTFDFLAVAVPEPSVVWLAGLGLGFLVMARHRSVRKFCADLRS